MRVAVGLVALASVLGLAPQLAQAGCKKGQVFVEEKTPLRRGPGLNYAVSSFLELGRCLKLGEVSIDQSWVMVSDTKVMGWVPSSKLDDEGRQQILGMDKVKSAPVGSGQTRGVVTTKVVVAVCEAPNGKVLRSLTDGAKVVPLSQSVEGDWVEVRDEHGKEGWVPATALEDPDKVLAELPKAEKGLETGIVPPPPPPPVEAAADPDKDKGKNKEKGKGKGKGKGKDKTDPIETAVVPPPPPPPPPVIDPKKSGTASTTVEPSEPLGIDLRVFGVAGLPRHQLDSNAVLGIRRYTISAFAPGARIQALFNELGPVQAAVGYTFLFLAGLEPKDAPGNKITGQDHEARATFGLPIAVNEKVTIAPQLGYTFSLFKVTPAIPGQTEGRFVSSTNHLGSLGAGLTFKVSETVSIEAELAGQAGLTSESPFQLAGNGMTIGVLGGAGVNLDLDGLNVLLRFDTRFRTTSYKGPSNLDPTISTAKLSDLVSGLSVGVGLPL